MYGGVGLTIRERTEQTERTVLCEYASLSAASRGRERHEEDCPLRTCYQRDRDRIIHCKAFRRLKHKTQVFLSPEDDHYRTRLTHTLEVAQIARTIARALQMNEDLTEAIALGHDLGHTPFGHAGERVLNRLKPGGFRHNLQSGRVVRVLEKDGEGLNLTFEVVDGIVNHTASGRPSTVEGRIVQISDRVAYINHDIDDAIRGGVIEAGDIPWKPQYIIGRSHSQRINTLINDIVDYSTAKKDIAMSPEMGAAFKVLYDFMFESVYTNPVAKSEEGKAEHILEMLYGYILKHPGLLHEEYLHILETDGAETAVCDYIAGMTDHYAVQCYQNLFIPKMWKK